VPSPKGGVEAYAAAVLRAVDVERIEVVIPITDLSASMAPLLRRERPDIRVAFPSQEAYERISDKRHLMEVARALGIPVPREIVLRGPGDPFDLATLRSAGLSLPVVLKPARSAVVGDTGVQSFGVSMVEAEADLASTRTGFPPEAYPLLVQERIRGPGLGAFMLTHDGRTVASFAHRRIREKPPTGGVSVYRESVPLRDDLRRYSQLLLEHFRWSGVAMVEFKEDAATGTPYLMEVNGRFWGSLQLAIDAGVDFPNLLMRAVLGEELGPVPRYRVGVRSRWLWGDVDHLIGMLKASPSILAAHPELPSRLGAVGRFLVPWRPGDRFEVLRLGDPGPFVRESVQWFAGVLGR
jgi:predicted ATP-grasp superfamily ATP-dependent carboligase